VIAVLDYGIGNLRSAEKALESLGADVRLVTNAEEASGASGVVLPGVGAFGACAEALAASGLEPVVREAISAGTPFLGICVGYQLLFEGSDESPEIAGLGVLRGRVRRLAGEEKLPQIQWNPVRRERQSRMLGDGSDETWFYFVHSFAPVPEGEHLDAVVGSAEYGERFACAVELGPLWAVQFHPEKSGKSGLGLLARFVDAVEDASAGLASAGRR
jgi:imidazole glycerol-phosphate synthase subunit HisH